MNRKGLVQKVMHGKETGMENWGLNKEAGKDLKLLFNKQQISSEHGTESKVSGSHQKIPDKSTGKYPLPFLLPFDSSTHRQSIVLSVTYSRGQICDILKSNKILFSTFTSRLAAISTCLNI